MQKIRKTFYIHLFFVCFLLVLPTNAYHDGAPNEPSEDNSWTVMLYAQTDSLLNNFVLQNFNAMATVGSNKKLNIIVQWNQPRKTGTWRYRIEKNKMTLIDKKAESPSDFSNDLVDFVRFASTKYPAEHYALIFSNHGVGVLDPEWDNLHNFSVNPTLLCQSPRIQIDGITKSHTPKRGILFDIPNRTYLDNQGLTNALATITRDIIGKKFALIGMDACLMSMFEICYQMKDFADYIVSSEEIELAQGWNYAPFLHHLAHTNLTAKQVSKIIVASFKDFYQNKTKFYTQSAIDLEGIEFIKHNIDQVVSNIVLCKPFAPEKIDLTLQRVRKLCFQLSIPCYVDLYSFYSELNKQCTILELEVINNRYRRSKAENEHKLAPLIRSQQFKDLQESLITGMKLLDHTIIANVASPYLARAKGISIYYPRVTRSTSLDPSYFKTHFAQDSLWVSFLQENTF